MKYFILIFVLSIFTKSFALSCGAPELEERLARSNDIFIGELNNVISVKDIDPNPWGPKVEVTAKLKVSKIIRGSEREYQVVKFSFNPKENEKYLIFNSSAYSGKCSLNLSTELKNADEYLKILGSKEAKDLHEKYRSEIESRRRLMEQFEELKQEETHNKSKHNEYDAS